MSLIVLAFDTSTEAIALGVGRADSDGLEMLVDESIPARRRANQMLLELVIDRLEECGLSINDVDQIVVGRGPGSFTGVRIGVAAAKGLAQGLRVPLFGTSTTEAVAVPIAAKVGHGTIGVIGDAMRGEVYPALFRVEEGRIVSSTPDRVADPSDVAREWADVTPGELHLAGNGLAKYRDVFEQGMGARALFAPDEQWSPSGSGLLGAMYREWRCLGEKNLPSGNPAEVLPVYTRLSDAEENERIRLGVAPVLPPVNGVAGGAAAATQPGGPSPSGCGSDAESTVR